VSEKKPKRKWSKCNEHLAQRGEILLSLDCRSYSR